VVGRVHGAAQGLLALREEENVAHGAASASRGPAQYVSIYIDLRLHRGYTSGLMKNHPIGGGLLIAGSCIGIGMLAMPIITGLAGFGPAVIIFFVCAAFMACTALLIVEADLALGRGVNIISLAQHYLGTPARIAAWILYLFLFASLMVAYVAKGGDILDLLFDSLGVPLPDGLGSVLLALISGTAIFAGRHSVDLVNRLFIVGFFISYLLLVGFGLTHVALDNLAHVDWGYFLFTIPFIVTAFGFHNMIPSISDYLKRQRQSIVLAVAIGVAVPLVVYLIWIFCIQGVVTPADVKASFRAGEISTELLYRVVQSPTVRLGALYMSFFAIITSVLGQGLGLVDFLFDGLRMKQNNLNRLTLCLLIFIPSILFARAYPQLFFKALELAGGIAAVALFGLLPVLMSWRGRYIQRVIGEPLLPGGRLLLAVLGIFSLAVLGYEIVKLF
jgi:tyrosine-specific transport protein